MSGTRCSLAVDARGLRQSGIGRYLREVLAGLLSDDRFGRITLLGHPGEVRAFLREQDAEGRARVVSFPHRFYAPGAHAHWALLQARGVTGADVVFFPHYDAPLTDRSPRTVVMVHDLAHFRLRGQFPAWKLLVASAVLARAVRRAGHVLVNSRFTAGDLRQRHPEVADRITCVPLGADPIRALPLPARAPEIDAWGEFLLCVGNRKPHKNLVAAVETLARVRAHLPGARLVLAGEDFGDDGPVRERARERGVADAVVWFGRASDEELAHLYARAGCLLFPSVFEGFGLPPLEAMAAGLPVVASDRGAIPEVLGDAASLADPHDWDAMAAAVLRVLRDPEHRAESVRRGRARAAGFRWSETAARVADVLAEAAQHGPPSDR